MKEIKELLCKAEDESFNLGLCWVPAHVNVEGNEKADEAAKELALMPPEATHRAIPHTDMRRQLKEAVLSRWHCRWKALGC